MNYVCLLGQALKPAGGHDFECISVRSHSRLLCLDGVLSAVRMCRISGAYVVYGADAFYMGDIFDRCIAAQ